MTIQNRQFHRIACQGEVSITHGGGAAHAKLVDLSLKGALTERSPDWTPRLDDRCTLQVQLENADAPVRMECRVAHIEPTRIGFHCLSIDIDSISFLKRLLELNLADPGLLERELSALR